MSYCNTGDNPKVYFKFGNSAEQIYESKISPIDVSIEDISTNTPNYNSSGFGFSFFSPNNGRSFDLVLRDYEIRDNGAGFPFEFRYELWIVDCSSTPMYSFASVDPSTITINTTITCGNEVTTKKKSKLHVRAVGSTTDIFTATGDYPGSFKVACGDCPPGTCRCDCDTYPGYCCLPCEQLQSGLESLIETAKSKIL